MTQLNNGNKTTPLNHMIVGEMKEEWRQARKLRNDMYAHAFRILARTVKELAEMVIRFVKKSHHQNVNIIHDIH